MNNNITVLLISHKSKNLVLKYIKNIYEKFKIIIIDNSNDVELKKIINDYYPNINIHLIPDNGYGTAINYGSKFVNTDYFLVSNPDINGINEKNLRIFLNIAKKLNNNFSALGPKYIDLKNINTIEETNKNEIEKFNKLSGACMFFYKKIFKEMNGFDENIYLYFEEDDYFHRSKKLYNSYKINTVNLIHNIGTSVETNTEKEKIDQKNLRTWHFIWSKFYFHKKHYGFLISFLYFLPIIFRINFRIMLYTIINDKQKIEKYIIRRSGLISSILNRKSSKRV